MKANKQMSKLKVDRIKKKIKKSKRQINIVGVEVMALQISKDEGISVELATIAVNNYLKGGDDQLSMEVTY